MSFWLKAIVPRGLGGVAEKAEMIGAERLSWWASGTSSNAVATGAKRRHPAAPECGRGVVQTATRTFPEE